MATVVTTLRLDPELRRRLRIIAVKCDLPLGEVVARLLAFAEDRAVLPDPVLEEYFGRDYAAVIAASPQHNAGKPAGTKIEVID